MSLVKSLSSFVDSWRREESGNVAVETVFMIPLLFWAYLGTFAFFDVYRHEGISFKANITIADMFSRETTAITDGYVDGAQGLLEFLSNIDDAPDLRVTAFRWNASDNEYQVIWSEARGEQSTLDTGALSAHQEKLPIMSDFEVALLVETWMDYERPFEIPLADGLYIDNYTVDAFTVISPRFATQICFEEGGNLTC